MLCFRLYARGSVVRPTRLQGVCTAMTVALVLCMASRFAAGDARAERCSTYVASIRPDPQGVYGAVARWVRDEPIELADLERDLEHVNSRRDCADFVAAGMLRLLFLDRDENRVPAEVKGALADALLGFKYWIDEPGNDSMCYWSENHQILYHSAEYLVGCLFPERVFTNAGMTGEQHRQKGKRLTERWLGWRERFGFAEWLSNCYYAQDFKPLFNLVDFAPDPAVAQRAAMAIDQLLLNMALNSFRGNFTCTHGRTYAKNTKSARGDSVKTLAHLVWGVRPFGPDVAGADGCGLSWATSKYRLPKALLAIGQDTESVIGNYQAHGLPVHAAAGHGLDPNALEAGMFFWGMGMYTHPEVVNTSARMWREYDLYHNTFFHGFARAGVLLSHLGLLDDLFRCVPFATEGSYLADAHTYTFRTPDYILSSALDRRPGRIAAQSLAWQAALDTDAVVFVTHPTTALGGSPGAWHGTAANPRVAQHRNVLIALQNAPWFRYLGERKRASYTHAWFPKHAFDEVEQRGHWVFGRKNDGYLALYSANPTTWQNQGEDAAKELIAEGRRNVWLCEMGRREDDGSFSDFIEAVAAASIAGDYTALRYHSPSLGMLEFGWKKPFRVAGQEMPLRRKYRYKNPYMQTPRFAERLEINAGGYALTLDFATGQRTGDGL